MLATATAGADAAPPYDFDRLATLAKAVERTLAERRARVALIARIGRPPGSLPPGVEFTHVAYAVYSRITTADGRDVPGYAVYNLYIDDERPQTSHLAQDFPIDYFAQVYRLTAGVIVPSEPLQEALLATITSPRYVRLHNARYSTLANPLRSRFQNCTGFVLDLLFASIYDTDDWRIIKSNIAAWFAPQPIALSPFALAMAPLFAPELDTSDHAGRVVTTTFWSIAAFMQRHRLAREILRLDVDPATLAVTTRQPTLPSMAMPRLLGENSCAGACRPATRAGDRSR
jgi:hypothetical protein